MNNRPVRLGEAHALVRGALDQRDLKTAREICEIVLDQCPADLTTWFLVGRAFLADEQWDEACAAFEHVVIRDPEHVKALASLGLAHLSAGRSEPASAAFERAFDLQPSFDVARTHLAALRTDFLDENGELPSTTPLATIHLHLRAGQIAEAVDGAGRLVARRPGDSAALLARAEALWRADRGDETAKVCRQVLARHPLTIKPRLILGQIFTSLSDRAEEGREILESTLIDDVTGVVRRRFMRSEGVESMPATELTVSLPVGLVGLGTPGDLPADDPPLAEIDAVDAAKAPDGLTNDLVETDVVEDDESSESNQAPESVVAVDPTPPAEPETMRELLVAISVRRAIVDRYGVEGLDRLERRLRAVERELSGLGTAFYAVYADDDARVGEFEVEPITAREPDEVKRVAAGILRAIEISTRPGNGDARQGIVLLGGDNVVPFFRILNPADDDDNELFTDNPYGRIDGHSILTPDIPVGRLPDGSSGTIAFLLRQLDNLVEARRRPRLPAPGMGVLAAGRVALQFLGIKKSKTAPFACATSDLETVAGHVVGKAAAGASVRSSPPVAAGGFDSRWLADRRCLHFSLNGRAGGDAWFGQPSRDVLSNDWLLPVALTARELSGMQLAAPVVFSATGYSIDVGNDNPTRSVSLRFLMEGAAGFIGSTSTCYGTNLLPVAGADLLGSLFWEQVRLGEPVGAALQTAKRLFAARALEDQGYLDGDDQKTLLQFVLLGDPLLTVFEPSPTAGDIAIDVGISTTDLLCNHNGGSRGSGSVDPRLVRAAVEVLTLRCPEAVEGAVRVQRRSSCDGTCGQSIHPDDAGSTVRSADVTSITARTDLPAPDGSHLIRYARATLAADGRIVKTLVSR